ncbi:MAG: C1 family peptidase [Nitrospirota bacterium]
MPVVNFSKGTKAYTFRSLDVRPDDSDARDYIFSPSLALLPPERPFHGGVPILDQGEEGACVGFALATVINVSLRQRKLLTGPRGGQRAAFDPVSARMLYELAKRYDEWKGENYDGTSPRGAMKGWHHHGVALEAIWPSKLLKNRHGRLVPDRAFTPKRADEAKHHPIGSYYRILDSDVSHVQAAVVEGEAILASAWVHDGWDPKNLVRTKKKGGLPRILPHRRGKGLHAFAIVGYTSDGFIIQNSWGRTWGSEGLALLHYEDWMEHRQDAWVVRPGPKTLDQTGVPQIFVVGFAGAGSAVGTVSRAGSYAEGIELTNPESVSHMINTGDKGALSQDGALITDPLHLPEMARKVLSTPTLSDGCHHVMLYAHGGLNSETAAATVADRLWGLANSNKVCAYFFIYESGWDEALLGQLKSQDDAAGPTGFSIGDAWEKFKQGLGDTIHNGQRWLGEKLRDTVRKNFWNEMKDRAQGATTPKGGACLFMNQLFAAMATTPNEQYKLHLVGHSAGSVYHGWLYQNVLQPRLQGTNVRLASIQFMAPAITIARAQAAFSLGGQWAVAPSNFLVYSLDPKDEDADSITIYPSSLLTYVADCLEHQTQRVPVLGLRNDFHAQGLTFATLRPARNSKRHGEFDEPGHEIEDIMTAIGQAQF